MAIAGTYYVQAGAFNTSDRAGLAVAGLEQLGARVMPGTSQGRPIFRVRIGPFRNAAQAQAAIEQVQALGRKDVLIVKEFEGA
jgi:cell division protein FtsN